MTLGRIVSIGARSPLGLDARQVALGQRAQKLTPRRLVLPDDEGVAFGTVRALSVADDVFGFDRLVALGGPALAECVETSPQPREQTLAIHLAVPDARPSADPRLGRPLLEALGEAASVRIDLGASTAVAAGHAGFAVALDRALRASRETGRLVVAGALDTHHDPAVLRWLAAEHRIHGPGTGDGFIPSEAAVFALVSANGAGGLARVEVIALGADEVDEEAPDPAIAAAMTEIVRRALDEGGDVEWIMTDVNGERHRLKEWSFVLLRHRDRLDPDRVWIDRPYVESGDAGAASGGLFAALACMAWELGFAPARQVLCALRAEGPARAAFVLGAP